ncbi:MAG TPA: hypothetical protein VN750_14225 [Steroidobacteraceae bacterium]|nr:hypothetical protein [Steroidobacteraceae bacterium]
MPNRLKVRSIPQPPYLRADPADIERWRPSLPQTGFRVGLVWRGNTTNAYDQWRSLPDLATLAPLWNAPSAEFVSLQKGHGEEEARAAERGGLLTHLGSDVRDFADTAAILSQLDLIVSIDTSTAHLAGALGRPLWVLADKVPDWRWRHAATVSEWYPSARVFYQHRSGDWSGAIDDVAEALKSTCAAAL